MESIATAVPAGTPEAPAARTSSLQQVAAGTLTSRNIPVFDTPPTPAPEGKVKLYHGTLDHHLESIAVDGLKGSENTMNPASWYMLTTSYKQAMAYSQGGKVVEFTMPETAIQKRQPDTAVWPGVEHNVYGFEATAYAPKGAVPAEYMTGIYLNPESQQNS